MIWIFVGTTISHWSHLKLFPLYHPPFGWESKWKFHYNFNAINEKLRVWNIFILLLYRRFWFYRLLSNASFCIHFCKTFKVITNKFLLHTTEKTLKEKYATKCCRRGKCTKIGYVSVRIQNKKFYLMGHFY